MRIDFRNTWVEDVDGLHLMGAVDNITQDQSGLHLFCKNYQGCAVMIDRPRKFGTWKIMSRITAGLENPSTKVCELLWPRKGTVPNWPPEIDFNESGDRFASHQTVHYMQKPKMFHSAYPIDQRTFHVYGVTVSELGVQYLCDGDKTRDLIPRNWGGYTDRIGEVEWNLHARTDPHGSLDVTRLDVRWMDIPD